MLLVILARRSRLSIPLWYWPVSSYPLMVIIFIETNRGYICVIKLCSVIKGKTFVDHNWGKSGYKNQRHGEKTWCFKCNSEKDVGQPFVGKTYRKTRNRPGVLLYTVIVIGSLLVLIGSYRFISVALFLNLHTPGHFHRLGHRTQGGGIGSRAPEGKGLRAAAFIYPWPFPRRG